MSLSSPYCSFVTHFVVVGHLALPPVLFRIEGYGELHILNLNTLLFLHLKEFV